MLPMLDPVTRNIVIPKPDSNQMKLCELWTLTRAPLWNILQQTDSFNDRPKSGRPRIATPGQDRYIQVFHLRNRIVSHQPLQSEYLDPEESARKQTATDFDSMVLDT